jgi:hypothetical protein
LLPEILKDVPVDDNEAQKYFIDKMEKHKNDGTNCYKTLKTWAVWSVYNGIGMDLPEEVYTIKEAE